MGAVAAESIRRGHFLGAGAEEEPAGDPVLEPWPWFAATSRLPSTSISTRRSGCRHWTSLRLLPRSGPILLHASPVIGWLSPLPSARILSVAIPLVARYSFTACARCSE